MRTCERPRVPHGFPEAAPSNLAWRASTCRRSVASGDFCDRFPQAGTMLTKECLGRKTLHGPRVVSEAAHPRYSAAMARHLLEIYCS